MTAPHGSFTNTPTERVASWITNDRDSLPGAQEAARRNQLRVHLQMLASGGFDGGVKVTDPARLNRLAQVSSAVMDVDVQWDEVTRHVMATTN